VAEAFNAVLLAPCHPTDAVSLVLYLDRFCKNNSFGWTHPETNSQLWAFYYARVVEVPAGGGWTSS
jgi:hypothetical protein